MILEARSTVCEESDTLRSINYLRESWLAVWGNIAMRAGVIKLNVFFLSFLTTYPTTSALPFLPIVRHYSFINLLMTFARKVFRRIVNCVPL